MKYLFILNDPPYGSERSYNALRLARDLAGEDSACPCSGGAACAHGGQKVPKGYYNVADTLSGFMRHRETVSVCGTCMVARGITDSKLIAGAARGTMDQLAEWTALGR